MNIELRNISKSFEGKCVFDDFSAVLPEGKCTVVTGVSGIGKTTLIRLISNLAKPDAGTVIGNDVRFSLVFQENRLCESLTTFDNLRLVCSDEKKIQNALSALGVEETKNMQICKLSGGQKRRIAIARALIAEYDVLCMDEPLTGLDADTKSRVIEYIKTQIKGKTAVIATHDNDAVLALSDCKIEL